MALSRVRLVVLAASMFSQVAFSQDVISIRADSWCPFNCEPTEAQKGYMVEIAEAAFKARGMKIDYQLLNWARSISETREAKFVAIVGAAKSDAEDFVFPEQSLGMQKSCFFGKPDDTWTYTGLPSLAGKTIGVTKDYSYSTEIDDYVKANEKDAKKIDVVSGDNPLEINIKKLKAGRLAAFLEDEAVVNFYLNSKKRSGELKNLGCVKQNDLYIAFSPKNPKSKEYAKILSDFVAASRKDGSLKTILAKYGMTDWAGK